MTAEERTFPSTSVGLSAVSKSYSFFPFSCSFIYISTGSSFLAPVLESAISGAQGWSREMIWGGRWEGGSCLGTHVHPWWSPGSFKWREHLNPHLGVQCVCVCVCVYVCVAQSWLALCNPMDFSLPGSSVHKFSRQEYWSGLLFPSPGVQCGNW